MLDCPNACQYEKSLQILVFGPDILHLVDNAVLRDVGFTPGDVICLKQNSQQWWNSADTKATKRKRMTPPSTQSTPPSKKVAFEKQYHDGGAQRCYGPRLVEGDISPGADFDWYYFSRPGTPCYPFHLAKSRFSKANEDGWVYM